MIMGPEPIIKMDLRFLFLGIFKNSCCKNSYQMGIKKGVTLSNTFKISTIVNHYFLCLGSEDTESFFLPLALLRASTFLPLADAILSLKPCLFLLFLFDG